MRALSPRERRLLAIGLLVASLALAQLVLISPILSGFKDRAGERAELLAAYSRNMRAIDAIPSLSRQAAAQQRDSGRFAFRADDATAANERLREWLGSRVTAAGGELRAVQQVSANSGWVRAWVDCRVTLPQLTALLQRLQNDRPYLIIESLTVAADRSFQTGALDLMDIRVEASGAYTASAAR